MGNAYFQEFCAKNILFPVDPNLNPMPGFQIVEIRH